MGMIQLDPASLTIGYVAGTLLCWYLNQTLNAKESEYEREAERDSENMYRLSCARDHDVSICSPERRIM